MPVNFSGDLNSSVVILSPFSNVAERDVLLFETVLTPIKFSTSLEFLLIIVSTFKVVSVCVNSADVNLELPVLEEPDGWRNVSVSQ